MVRLVLFSLLALLICVGSSPVNDFSDHVKDKSSLSKLTAYKDQDLLNNYLGHLKQYNKVLANADEVLNRVGIYRFNQKLIKDNQEKEKGNAVHGCTKFCDRTTEEFLKSSTGYKNSSRKIPSTPPTGKTITHLPDSNGKRVKRQSSIPDSFSWSWYGYVSAVKDQGDCGSCVSFASAAVIESVWGARRGQYTAGNYSEEELVDCAPGSNQCGGSSFDNSFNYVGSKGGIVDYTTYPYNADGSHACTVDANAARTANVTDYFTADSEAQIQQYIYWYGPMAIAIDATPLQTYVNGTIYADPPCGGWSINHAVELVGWGLINNQTIWLAKNSWGPGWGEEGYFQFLAGVNMMNILHEPVSVITP